MPSFDKASVAWRIADLANSVDINTLPSDVIREAKRRLVDSFSCMFSGVDGEASVKVRNAALALGGSEHATIIGTQYRSSIDKAALINCSSLRQLDFMDGHPGPYPAHASLNIPPLLAVAEYLNAPGRELLLAIILAYEFNIRLQLSAGKPDIGADGWNGASILATAAAVGMSRLLRLSTDETAHAITIATTHAPTLDAPRREQMPESKSCMDGVVAASTVLAVFMARAGLTGPEKVFEGTGGFAKAVSKRLDADILLAPIDRFRIVDVYSKRYNAVKCAQTAVAAALKVAATLPGGWRDIARLEIGLPEYDYHHQLEDIAARKRPRTRDTANHSVFYCVAAGLVDGDLGPDQFNDDRLQDGEILDLIDKISVTLRPELTPYWPQTNPVRIDATVRDGKRASELLLYSPGHPKAPLSDNELRSKFRRLAPARMETSAIDKIVALVEALDTAESVRPLMENVSLMP